jgi:hypothetical protein
MISIVLAVEENNLSDNYKLAKEGRLTNLLLGFLISAVYRSPQTVFVSNEKVSILQKPNEQNLLVMLVICRTTAIFPSSTICFILPSATASRIVATSSPVANSDVT